ncbi:sensor histidine kinase [Kitasatospora sp. NE20-6]|uniref:ATP-binding protein n=1 Tax=Kitasatospora sp. NE20-6 TaxID=2859066 RepID=UPI0038B286CD
MTQWCAAAAVVLAVLAVLSAARYRAVGLTLRRRHAQQQDELESLHAQLASELARSSAEHAAARQEQDHTAATQRAFLSVARRILVMAHDQQAGLDEMERTHDDPALLEGLLKADHAAAQQARLAQTLAVLCGARAGRHWPEPVSLEDVVRGAQSRILPFQRVVVRSRLETAVIGAAAEALIHAVAELLDNATRYSPPSTQVFVTLLPVHNGAVVEIDDAGVGMPEQAVEKAAAALAGGGGLEVSRLGEVPQLGLAAVGRLAEQYGFRVTLSSAPSPYGGVRVVVLLPGALLTDPLPEMGGPGAPAPYAAARPSADRPRAHRPLPDDTSADRARTRPDTVAAGTAAAAAADADEAATTAPDGPLPRRSNRRHAAPAAARPDTVPAAVPEPPRSAREAQAFMALFQAGTASGRSATLHHQPPGSPAEPPTGPAGTLPASPQQPLRAGDSYDHQQP